MEFLEAIGGLSLVAIGLYFLFKYADHKEQSDRENKRLIENSGNCQRLIREYYSSVAAGKPIMTSRQLKKQLNEIIRNPEAREYERKVIERRNESEKKLEQKIRNQRKIGYKYEIEIFEIFDTNRELSHKNLILKIQLNFNINAVKANELLVEWKENELIKKCTWNDNNWEVGIILTDEFFNFDETDLTRRKWLAQEAKTLKPESNEYRKYVDGIDL